MLLVFFFFKQKTAYDMRISDWSSDVCSSDLWLAGSSPTSTTARPGVRPCSAFSPVTAAATRAVNLAAKALPSIKSASPAVLLAALLVKALSPIDLSGGASSPDRPGRPLSDCATHLSRPPRPPPHSPPHPP